MGEDKARLEVSGAPLIHHVAQAVRPFSAAGIVTIVGGEPDLLELAAVDASHVPDRYPGEGPLGAIITALEDHAATASHVLVTACDLPRLDAQTLGHLARESVATDADVCVPLSKGRRQWHVAIWNVRCCSDLHASFDGGNRSIWRAASGLRQTLTVTAPGHDIVDLDTPEDVTSFGEK